MSAAATNLVNLPSVWKLIDVLVPLAYIGWLVWLPALAIGLLVTA